MKNSICDISGIKVGHYSDFENLTGCTVILCEEGAVCGVNIRGGAPGTRETDLLNPSCLVEKIQAICLAGGSAFGLAAADGVMQYLEEKKVGFPVGKTVVPIVPSAIIFDLNIGSTFVRPTKEWGYKSAQNASLEFATGSIGAGTGATIGKYLGLDFAMKGGVGTSSIKFQENKIIGALAVVNCMGDIYDEQQNKIIAGCVNYKTKKFLNSEEFLLLGKITQQSFFENTTLVVVATNVTLNKVQINKLAELSQNALSQVIKPANTMFDGDTVFVLSYGNLSGTIDEVAIAAQIAIKSAIKNAVKEAKSLGGVLSYAELNNEKAKKILQKFK